MKKTYQIPTATVVNVKPQLMTEASKFNNALGGEGTGGSGSKALGRRGSVWDDDEE